MLVVIVELDGIFNVTDHRIIFIECSLPFKFGRVEQIMKKTEFYRTSSDSLMRVQAFF
jgi:hypothetical protein